MERLGGLAERKTVFDSLKTVHDNIIFLDSGGILSRRPTPSDDDIVSAVYAEMGYDAVCIGHQEFINGMDYFKNNLYGKLPFVSANLQFEDEAMNIDKYKIIETKDGLKVGVTGVNYINTFKYLYRMDALSEKDLIIGRAFDELRPVLKELNEKSDIVIILAQLNEEALVRLIDDVDGYDLVIGGNNLTEFKYARNINGKIQVQNGRDGEKIGKVMFKRNDDGKLEFESYELIKILARNNGYSRDEKIDKIIIDMEGR